MTKTGDAPRRKLEHLLLNGCRGVCLVIAVFSVTLPIKTAFLYGDDGFYALTVSRNIARGLGVAIDEHTPTSGVQPLWCYLLAPAYWQKAVDPLRIMLLVSAALLLGAACLFASIMTTVLPSSDGERRRLFWSAAAMYLLTEHLFWMHFNVLETGLVVFLTLVACKGYLSVDWSKTVHVALFGGLLGLLVLARVDTGILVAALLAVTLHGLRKAVGWRAALGRVGLAGGVATLVSSPWWYYNLSVFGHFMPQGGLAEQSLEPSWPRLRMMTVALAGHLLPYERLVTDYLGSYVGDGAVVVLGGLSAVLVIRYLRRAPIRFMEGAPGEALGVERRFVLFLGAYGAFIVVLSAYYLLASHAIWFYARYLVHLLCAMLVIWVALFDRLAAKRPALAAAVGALAALHFALGAWRARMLWQPAPLLFEAQAALVERHVPPGEIVAADQTGTLGYLWSKTLNLDGKVNAEALAYVNRHETPDYVIQRGVHWFCDWPPLVARDLGRPPEARGWKYVAQSAAPGPELARGPFPRAPKGVWLLYHRE